MSSEDLGTCDGEVLFGFTVKACHKSAVRVLKNDPYEVYHFCAKHYHMARHGSDTSCQVILDEGNDHELTTSEGPED